MNYLRILLCVALLATLVAFGPGCSPQTQAKLEQDLVTIETKAHAMLTWTKGAMQWTKGHEAEIKAWLDVIAADFPDNPTVQATVRKAKAALDSGDFDRAQQIVSAGAAVLAPTPGPAPVPSPGASPVAPGGAPAPSPSPSPGGQ